MYLPGMGLQRIYFFNLSVRLSVCVHAYGCPASTYMLSVYCVALLLRLLCFALLLSVVASAAAVLLLLYSSWVVFDDVVLLSCCCVSLLLLAHIGAVCPDIFR